jgi:hypothetical protein
MAIAMATVEDDMTATTRVEDTGGSRVATMVAGRVGVHRLGLLRVPEAVNRRSKDVMGVLFPADRKLFKRTLLQSRPRFLALQTHHQPARESNLHLQSGLNRLDLLPQSLRVSVPGI